MRNKFHLNRTQRIGWYLTENTVWIHYREKSIYPVTVIPHIYCETHTVCKYTVWSKCKICNVTVDRTYIYSWDLKDLWNILLSLQYILDKFLCF